MLTADTSRALSRLFAELINGATPESGGFILNTGDAGMLASLDKLSAADASRSSQGGATIAAHATHVSYGLSLMNRWAAEGGDPFADAKWDEAWKVSAVDESRWGEIRRDLRTETNKWLTVLSAARSISEVELCGLIASVAHLAYHLGAIRQIDKQSRGPKEHAT